MAQSSPSPGLGLRPLTARADIVPFSAVWSSQNDIPAPRRFLSVVHVLVGAVGMDLSIQVAMRMILSETSAVAKAQPLYGGAMRFDLTDFRLFLAAGSERLRNMQLAAGVKLLEQGLLLGVEMLAKPRFH